MEVETDYEITKAYQRAHPRFDREAIMHAVTTFLTAVGRDPQELGLRGTPDRVARMVEEVLEGELYSNDQIADAFGTTFTTDSTDLVVVDHIPAFSYCEHHLALMYNMYVSVAYVPRGSVIGLSKIARIVDLASKRLQLQERIGNDVADILMKVLKHGDVAVIIEGEHSCMTARGIRKSGAKTHTASLHGCFLTNSDLRKELYAIINGRHNG